ncbi:MAG: sigma-54-dependent Fis family transcriptional regulator [Deltaproteobacteria bacterium]|nr:sigma-54-dependent Fis family transcriptional regulator [Deltaproteobacteria bacterium]
MSITIESDFPVTTLADEICSQFTDQRKNRHYYLGLQNMFNVSRELPNGQQLVGESLAFRLEIEKIPVVARSDAGVFITGETGTGKELCAKAIHYASPRADKLFVPVNCGAIPTDLLENELFGHKTGAFTSASTSQFGLIQEADKGTLFLDEVTSLSLSAQVKLLRFLQEKEYRPLGCTNTIRANVRIIAASNIEIEEAVREGTLRRDLYYRLNVIPIRLPPLRERPEDITILAQHFLAKYSANFNKKVSGFSRKTMQALVLYDWPGNVRELQHVVQRATVFTGHDVIEPSDIVLQGLKVTQHEESFKEAKKRMITQFERNYITKLLVVHQGNITRAAQAAGKNRRAFWELIRRHRIDVQRFKPHRPS